MATAAALLAAAFAVPLFHLAAFALHSELYSYILIVPAISAGLAWMGRARPPPASAPARPLAAVLFAAGVVAAAGGAWMLRRGADWGDADLLAPLAAGFVLCFAGLCAWFAGRRALRAAAFPLAFLILLAPLPTALSEGLETFFQHTSAVAAYWFFLASGTPVFRPHDLIFRLPGMNLEVAPECSGLHSSLALVITSLPAGYLLLRSPWRRAALTLAAVPLGIVRNGFRIFTIGELCVHIGPRMIDSYIHRTGGWIFFLLSLAPLFVLISLLAWSERRASRPAPPVRT